MNDVIEKILLEVSLDNRVDGVFDTENNDHMLCLREYLIKKGIQEQIVNEFSNLVMEKGKHPERQAYNKSGLIVTFPTPEYKKRAIERGTHFETNPVAANSNLFGGGDAAPQQPKPTEPEKDTPPNDTPSSAPANDTPSAPAAPETPPKSLTPQGTLSTEPPAASTPSADTPAVVAPQPVPPQPVPVQKTPEQIEAEKYIIKKILSTGEPLPTVNEELQVLIKIASVMNLNEALKVLTKLI